MRSKYFRRSILPRLLKLAILVITIWTTIDVFAARRAFIATSTDAAPPFKDERIFIASIHWTDEEILRTHWIPAIIELAREIGPKNVFVSIEESGSLDDTKGALQTLDEELVTAGIPHKITLDPTSRLDVVEQTPAENGWIVMPFDKRVKETWTTWTTIPKGKHVPRRIPYLADLRNSVLRPLYELEQVGEKFDKILFLNDVVFRTSDVRRLLSTNDGDYAAACALDFKKAPAIYDTFATRDFDGYELLMDTWPYFRSPRSYEAARNNLPIPVTSCWNGMLIMDAAPFYDQHHRLSFRALPDELSAKHLEASECCLIHTDNPLSQSKGVWINPNVRVGYRGPTYDKVNPNGSRVWLSSLSLAIGPWVNLFRRWTSSSTTSDRMFSQRLAEWRKENLGQHESGRVCLVDETQILLFNGWIHI